MGTAASPGLFITFEGVDGVGKSTQIERLAEHLQAQGREAVVTFEPGGTPLGAAIDRLLKHDAGAAPGPRAELLLFLAARAQHVDTVIRPALAAGRIVLCSRFTHSTLAYQGAGLGLDEAAVRQADAFARDGCWPDAVVVFDAEAEAVKARLGQPRDRIEDRAADYHQRVREGFRRLAAEDPARVRLVAAGGTPDEVQAALREALAPWL